MRRPVTKKRSMAAKSTSKSKIANKAAADLAWERTLDFFRDNLGTPPKAS